MKALSRGEAAFTRRDLMVVVATVMVFACLLIPRAGDRTEDEVHRITCINNLKQIGVAYRIWANDNGDSYPADVAQTNGGWRDLLGLPNAGSYGWTNYAAMAKEFGQSPANLVCPTDERKPASAFTNLANTNISYFIGPGANDTYPQALLGGDRNLGPGTTPRLDYGFSPDDGKGNDVIISGPVCWSLKMHSKGNAPGCGNILLGDASAQQLTSGNLNANWLKPTMLTTNDNTVAKITGIRLIFP